MVVLKNTLNLKRKCYGYTLLANKKLKHSNHPAQTSKVELRCVYLLIKKRDRAFFIMDNTDNFRKEKLLLKFEFKLDRVI